jgi:Asp-tRNA(Asn)/Glu-tRNA(Gln) amidotransferase A subunit family amidase
VFVILQFQRTHYFWTVCVITRLLKRPLRPASYCGVTGFKATYGLLPLNGVLPYAKSLDTLGFFTHTPADMLSLWEALGHSTGTEQDADVGVPESFPKVEPEMSAAFQNTVSTLRKAGIPCRTVDISAMLTKLDEAQHIVLYYEGARFHQSRFKQFGDRLGHVATVVREGMQIPEVRYLEAQEFITESRRRMKEMYSATPIILVPAATGPAPLGLSYTGDSRMNTPWTALGTPAISVPMPVAADALPLGLQVTAAPGEDWRVMRAAVRLHRILNN